jgi:phenylacetate-CoA ligase
MIRGYEDGLHGRSIFRYWRELEASQWRSRDEIAAIQFQGLRRLLLHAQSTSPWYGDTWRAGGLDARRLDGPEDFAKWPVIDRALVREHRLAMRSTAPGTSLITKATGGSSGVPLEFDLDTDSYQRRMAAWHRGYSWAGAGPGTKQWYLWGVAPVSSSSWSKRKAKLYDRLYRHTLVSCFDLGDASVDRFFRSLVRTEPRAIVAYTNAIYAFAQMLEARALVPPVPHSIVVGAERLHPFQREVIERVFRAPVFETYGSREFMLIGAECAVHGGLHLTSEQLVVEILDDDGAGVRDGVEGNVVITDLTNLGMPFVRYATGDRAIKASGPCACGRGLDRLARVTGRQLDILVTPDGRRLPGEFFPHILKDLPGVRRYQVIQEVADAVIIRIVSPRWAPEHEAWLRREVAAVAGPALRVSIDVVDDIPLTAAGKLQVVVNRLGTAPTIRERP